MKVLRFVFAFGLGVTMLWAQSQLPKFTSNPAKIFKGALIDQPKDFKMPLKKMTSAPKKVALVSFYTFDPGLTRVTDLPYSWSKTEISSEGNSGNIAVALYENGLESLRSTFAEYGMDLLTPDQFLTSDDKREAYNSFQVQKSKSLVNFLDKLGEQGHNVAWGYPEGYIITDIVLEPFPNYTSKAGAFSQFKAMKYKKQVPDNRVFYANNDTKLFSCLGDGLAKELDVDAVLIIYSTIYCPSEKQIILQNVNMMMYGPNPKNLEPGNETKEPGRFYSRGLVYPGVRLRVGVPLISVNKKDPDSSRMDATGFSVIMEQMAKKMGESIRKDLKK